MDSGLSYVLRSWLKYFISSKTLHQVDSPFVFDFCQQVLEKQSTEGWFERIEKLRKDLLSDSTIFNRVDHGAGTSQSNLNGKMVRIKDFVKRSAITAGNGKILNRIVQFSKPASILELGTAAGISGAYLISPAHPARLITIEGDPVLASLAKNNFNHLGLPFVQVIEGKFEAVLPGILDSLKQVDLVFIDGHHRGRALFSYIDLITPYLNPHRSVIILDDIHWNQDMTTAWQSLRRSQDYQVTIDLFQFGLLIRNPNVMAPVHFDLIASKWKPWTLGIFR